ncbi:ribulokinase [Planomonospora parontospora subsp. parontospora]|uniref:Ribulokinase n=2 Tax=Planomonospora parontospora TaxID=58119 RepID=A0AA37BLL7_9ACTN|nr:ribulokinase [Planomonospora parontospora]GGK87629.1 ribulokinase [Planomonospora parontospora]GII11386.1 ribulokinase [Planomonospora parontospora subsp. parontospora]
MNANSDRYVVGVDFGTLSGRAVVVRVADGAELGSAVHEYPHRVIDDRLPGTDVRLGPDWALQSPEDWREVLRTAVPEAIIAAGISPAQVVGIGTDFTACTVLPATTDGTPLCETEGLAARPHAWPKLWKHHAAQPHADRINAAAAKRGETWLPRYGGKISSEWQFAKALQVLEEDPEVYAAADHWIEAADWIVWQLTGVQTRNVCTAGYKAIRQDGTYPSDDFLAELNPALAGLTGKLGPEPVPLGGLAGTLSATAAGWTGLPEGIAVAVGNVDAHVTAAAADAVRPGQMVAIMGTSTCHIMPSDSLAEVPGMCGVVRDGIVPGLWGYEAGQSAVGDIFGWFVDTCVPGSYEREAERKGVSVHEHLAALAAEQAVGQHGLVVLDWHNGNRSVLVDHDLSAVVVGQTLATRPEDTYRALIEATAFGARTIVEAFESSGVPVREFVVAGGLLKNRFLMQVYADVLRRPLSVIGSEQGCALGSAIHAAVAAGAYPDITAAAAAMGKRTEAAYLPDPERADAYDRLYAEYRRLHDHFGRGEDSAGAAGAGRNDVLHRLRALRNEAGEAGA